MTVYRKGTRWKPVKAVFGRPQMAFYELRPGGVLKSAQEQASSTLGILLPPFASLAWQTARIARPAYRNVALAADFVPPVRGSVSRAFSTSYSRFTAVASAAVRTELRLRLGVGPDCVKDEEGE